MTSKEPIITFEIPFLSPLKQLLTFGIIPLEIIPFDFKLSKVIIGSLDAIIENKTYTEIIP